MANSYFKFKKFLVNQDACAMKVTTDACLFGAWCAAEIAATGGGTSLLDIGAGTGLLSLMVAQKNDLKITAVEIDAEAAKQAGENFKISPWSGNITILHTDIKTLDAAKRYDYVISNPPFYENQLLSPNDKRNKAHHSNGLTLQQLMAAVTLHLTDEGLFFLLLPFRRNEEVLHFLKAHQLSVYQNVSVQQTFAHQPFRTMLCGGKKAGNAAEKTIAIKGKENRYTPEFTDLLEAYYLYL